MGQISDQMREMVGQVVGGCRLDAPLGAGSSSLVFRAHHLSLDKKVAIKLLLPSMRNSELARKAFDTEAKIASAIEHSSVVPVYNVGREGDYSFIILRHLEGASLYRVLSRQGIEAILATKIVEQVASALGEVHAQGFVHRDVKPENILLTQRGQAFLTDFGVATPIGEQAPAGKGGTPAYMSPEQCEGKPLDGRSDFYSLGVTFYQMLSGRRPFLGESPEKLMKMHQEADYPPLLSMVKEGIPLLGRIVDSLLAKEPEERPSSAKSLCEDLALAQEELRALRRRKDGIKFRKRDTASSQSGFNRLIKEGSSDLAPERESAIEDVELGMLLLESGENPAIEAQADQELSLEGYQRSLDLVNKAILGRPKDADLYITRGNLLRRMGESDAVEADYRKALELSPDSARAMTALGAWLRVLGHMSEAEKLLRDAIKRDKDSVEARIALGKIYENAGASSLARQQYIKATKAAPNDERGFVALAGLLIGEQKYESAAESLERARDLNPGFAPTVFWLSVVHATRDEPGEAIDLIEKALSLGLRDKEKLVSTTEFEPLRELKRFQELLAREGL